VTEPPEVLDETFSDLGSGRCVDHDSGTPHRREESLGRIGLVGDDTDGDDPGLLSPAVDEGRPFAFRRSSSPMGACWPSRRSRFS
jgi:hypothetical protein